MVGVTLLLAAQSYVGTAACVKCHPQVAASQSKTHHAAALQFEGGRWTFGAGAQAKTFVSQEDEDHYLEHGLSWYRKSGDLALTPGHTDETGVRYRTFAADASILRCFQCHSTGKLRLEGRAIQPAEPGVRCENCHGPGSAHAGAPGRGNIRNPVKLSPAAINELCGECHRMPPAKGVATNWENPWNARHQPVYLSQAPCFQQSGKLSCLTCHRPHSDEPIDTNERCVMCHDSPRHVTATAGKTCVACHMPDVMPSERLRFANHWIGIYGSNPLRPVEKRPRR